LDRVKTCFDNIKVNQVGVKNPELGINRDYLVSLLRDHGDKMDEKEINECLQVLMYKDDITVKSLPDVLTFDNLLEILGFIPTEDESK
jgi:hypothetical protein